MIRSFLTSFLILLCFALFETAILSNIHFLPAIPDFILICSLFFSFNNGRLLGVTNGFISGLFLDFLTAAPLGLHCLVRTIIGYICGVFNKTLNLNGIFLPALIGFCATILKAFFIWVISIFFPISIDSSTFLSFTFLFELIANTILTPIVFKFLSIFKRTLILNTEKVS